MFFTFGTPRELHELAPLRGTAIARRKEAEILVIDDKGFGYLELLRDHHYHVHHVFDIEDIRSVSEYHVIACDIMGVGKRFSSRYQGAHVISEIHKLYPHKIVIGYSTRNFDATFNQYLRDCDSVIDKDVDSEEWQRVLDMAAEQAVDPILQWKRVRDFLLKKDASLFTVLKLEQDYVSGLIEKNPDRFPRSTALPSLSPDLRAVVQGFAGNMLFKLITG